MIHVVIFQDDDIWKDQVELFHAGVHSTENSSQTILARLILFFLFLLDHTIILLNYTVEDVL